MSKSDLAKKIEKEKYRLDRTRFNFNAKDHKEAVNKLMFLKGFQKALRKI